jgi:hypothetical protein
MRSPRRYFSGGLTFDSFWAAYLPDKIEGSDAPVSYGIGDKDQRLTATVNDAQGNGLGRFIFMASNKRGEFRKTQIYRGGMKIGGQDYVDRVALGEGQYTIEFSLNGEPFYRFPLTVKKLASGKKDVYGTVGPWSDWGCLDTNDPVKWQMWMRKDNPDASALDTDLDVRIQITRSGKVVAVNRDTDTYFSLHTRDWKLYQIPLVANTPEQPALTATTLFAGDGNYEVVVTINGAKQSYPFQVKDRKFVLQGRQTREGADPLQFIEAEEGEYFVMRQGGTNK